MSKKKKLRKGQTKLRRIKTKRLFTPQSYPYGYARDLVVTKLDDADQP